MIFGYELDDIFTFGNLIYTAIISVLTWWLKERLFQKQQLRAGDIDNEIKEAEQGLKEVELLRETIAVYKDVNNDLRTEVSELRESAKTHRQTDKKIVELEKKIDELFTQLAIEKENSEKLLKENTELRRQLNNLQKDYDQLKAEFDKYKKAHK